MTLKIGHEDINEWLLWKGELNGALLKDFILFCRDDKVGGIMATWKRVAIYYLSGSVIISYFGQKQPMN